MSTTDFGPAGFAPPVSPAQLAALASQLYAGPGGVGVEPPAPPVAPPAPRGSVPDGSALAAVPEHRAPSPGGAWLPATRPGAATPGPWQPGDRLELPLSLGPWTEPTVGLRPTSPSAFGALLDVAGLPTGRAEGVVPVASGRDGGLAPIGGLTSEAFDVASARRDFPILTERVNGHQLIWFDNAATTHKPQAVIDRLAHFYAHENSNIHRAAHTLAARATDAYEDARATVRDFLGAARAEEIIFVRGATEGINLVAQSWGRKNLLPGDEILISQLEHHANIVPWQIVAKATGAVLKTAPVDEAGNLLLGELAELIGPRTKLVALTWVANAIGTVTPVREVVELAHRAGARVLIDGAQSVPHLPVSLASLGSDFFVFSGHKIYGPTGIGVVYLAERVWEETPAWHGGGNMIADVTIERSIYQDPPNKYEAGTGNIADAVGLAAALRYVSKIGIDRIANYEAELLDYATPRLAAIPGVRLVGTAQHKASVLSFVLAGHEPEDVGYALNQRGIAVRAGHHCAQPILRRLGLEKTVRPSFAFYNTFDEIDLFLQAVADLSSGE